MQDPTGTFREPTCSHGYGMSLLRNGGFHPNGDKCADVNNTGKKSTNPVVVALIVVGVAILALCLGGIVVAAIGAGDPQPKSTSRGLVPDRGVTPTLTPTSTVGPALTATDFEVSVKIKSKECFGSAGCLVEFKLDMGVDDAVRARLMADGKPYEITYEVSGFTTENGNQIGTIDVEPDGTFSQNEYQSGSTAKKSSKLTVKITDVQRGL